MCGCIRGRMTMLLRRSLPAGTLSPLRVPSCIGAERGPCCAGVLGWWRLALEELLITLVLLLIVVVIGGSVCGIVALLRIEALTEALAQLRREGENRSRPAGAESTLRKADAPLRSDTPRTAVETSAEETRPASDVASPPPQRDRVSGVVSDPGRQPHRPSAASSAEAFELRLGRQWLARGGMLMFLIGMVLLLRFAYDHALIGPAGRILMGGLTGLACLVAGEWLRRRGYGVLFQSLTGGGLGIFYLCVYFAFAVYGFIGTWPAMLLAMIVTTAAVIIAVFHGSVAIALFGLAGGYLSPLLLGGGEDRPYALFGYVLIVNLVALGLAAWRAWHQATLLAFVATVVLYVLWYVSPQSTDTLVPGLLFTTLFFLLFLLAPLLHGLWRRVPQDVRGLSLIAGNSTVWLLSYYALLYGEHRRALGFVVLAQAALLLAAFRFSSVRVPEDLRAAAVLLAFALAMALMSVPLHFSVYGVAIAWALQGGLLAAIAWQYPNPLLRLATVVALLLALFALLLQLPLHDGPFTPVLNAPFASWWLVIAAMTVAVWLLRAGDKGGGLQSQAMRLGVVPYAMACLVLSLEVAAVTQHLLVGPQRLLWSGAGLLFLWSGIPLLTAVVLRRLRRPDELLLACAGWGIAAIIAAYTLAAMADVHGGGGWPGGHPGFWACLALVASLVVGSRVIHPALARVRPGLEVAIHVILALTLAAESVRFANVGEALSREAGLGLVSALWAAQGVALVWWGLARGHDLRRKVGFGLLAVAAGKTVLVDTAQLAEVYRILSYLALGVLLLLGGYVYQRYARGDDEAVRDD